MSSSSKQTISIQPFEKSSLNGTSDTPIDDPPDDHHQATKTPIERLKDGLLWTFHQAQPWQREDYLHSSYRKVQRSYRASCASLGYVHNETSNILTHAGAAALFAYWARHTYLDVLTRYPTAEFGDYLVFGVYMTSALCCFGFSALFHLFMDHSQQARQVWLLADQYGVFGLITATFFSGTYYGFYCERHWWKVYSAGVCASLVTFQNADISRSSPSPPQPPYSAQSLVSETRNGAMYDWWSLYLSDSTAPCP